MLSQGYFDYNATTPMCQQAIESLNGALCDFGNPSSKYSMATANRHRLDVARKQVARLVGCDSSEIAFTSGGTEANNWAIKGALTSRGCLRRAQPAHIIVSEIEHSSVLEIAAYLERVFGFEVTRIKPNSEGIISAKSVEAALRPNTQLVSIMLVNNEVGTLQPASEISKLLQPHGIHFHADGVQAVGKIHVHAHEIGVDSLSFAAHKFYGPKGVGGLYIKSGITIEPLLHGGGQESGLRGGTEAVSLITAMGAAAELSYAELPELLFRATNHRITLSRLLMEGVPGVSFHGPSNPDQQIPYTLSVCIDGIRAEALAAILDQMHGIQVSLGSACSNNKTMSLSHVLLAMGVSERNIKSTFRVSFGRLTEAQDLKRFASAVTGSVRSLQRISRAVDHEQTTSA